MTSSNCHFTWLKQKDTMISLAQSLYKDPTYFDCQLCAEGHHFNVHRVILSCNSPVLSSILQEHKTDNPVITLDGVSPLELGALVEFMYTGVTRISSNFLVNFFQTAKSLQLAGLGHYDDLQIDKFLGEDGSSALEEAEELQDDYEGYGENVLNCLEMDDEIDSSDTKELQNISTDEGIFLNDRVIAESELIDQNSVEYDKYQNVLVKQEVEDQSLDQTDAHSDGFSERCNTDDTVENSDISTPFSKIETVLVNQSNEGESEDLMDDSITAVYSVCKDDTGMKEDSEYITVDNKVQIAEEDEKFVFVNIDSSVFQRLKENQVWRVKQEKNDGGVRTYSDKYVRLLNPNKKTFKKRPKHQNVAEKNSKGSSDDKKIYICLKCGNKYSHRRTLLHHIHWICEQPATYSCSLCPYMGKRKFQLKSHMKHAHMLRMS